jgi:predicted AAA+ superfamily ATPase
MATYMLQSLERVAYRRFIDDKEFTHLNNSIKYRKEYIEECKTLFNDELIYEVEPTQSNRDIFTFSAIIYSKKKLVVDDTKAIPFGVYDLDWNQEGPCLKDSNITKHNTILPIHSELKGIIEKCKFNDKNNILLYGAPGNGKTQSVIDLANNMNDLMIINVINVDALRYLKYLPKENKKILIFEEFTETLQRNEKRLILNFLDGIDSVSNCISIMSTNYPKELESNIIDRPSRVRHFLEYKNPNKDQINTICAHFGTDPDFFYGKDYSVDNIINVIKTSKDEGISIKEANSTIMDKRKFLSETFKASKGGMGIGLASRDDDYDDED